MAEVAEAEALAVEVEAEAKAEAKAEAAVTFGASQRLYERLRQVGIEPMTLDALEGMDEFVKNFDLCNGSARGYVDTLKENLTDTRYKRSDQLSWELQRVAAIMEKLERQRAQRISEFQDLESRHVAVVDSMGEKLDACESKLKSQLEMVAKLEIIAAKRNAEQEVIESSDAPVETQQEFPEPVPEPEAPTVESSEATIVVDQAVEPSLETVQPSLEAVQPSLEAIQPSLEVVEASPEVVDTQPVVTANWPADVAPRPAPGLSLPGKEDDGSNSDENPWLGLT